MFTTSLLALFSFMAISCVSRKGPPKPTFVNDCYSLKKGMRVDQVMKILGDPIASNTQNVPGVPEQCQVFHFHDNISKQLMAVFLGDKLMTASLSDTEDKFTDMIEIIKYDPMDFMPLQFRPKATSPSPVNSPSSYEDQKKALLDKYLSKEISKAEYFDLRRDLDRSK